MESYQIKPQGFKQKPYSIFTSVRLKKKKKSYFLEAETQWRVKSQTHTPMKMKVSPDKAGQTSLMCGYWVVSLIHSLTNIKHLKNPFYNR